MVRTPQRRRLAIATAIVGIASAAVFAAYQADSFSINRSFGSPVADASSGSSALRTAANRGGNGTDTGNLSQSDDTPRKYVVVFRDAPLASYKGGVRGLATPAREGNGRGRIDVKAASSLAYVGFLQGQQRGYETRIGQALGRTLKVERRMQHALNAIVAEMSPLEAEAIARLPEVMLVDAPRDVPMDTDVGPTLIGATNIWQGIPNPISGSGQGMGEGVIVGIIDSGINFGSPSFAAVDPIDGYAHVNPNGSGNYLGTCAPGGVDEGRCNDKLIGGYDFVCGAPGNSCVSGRREEPGFGDTNGHGSHTASTAAGNHRQELFNGSNVAFSGVAPRANVIAYDVCYTLISTGQGLCPGLSSAAAVDQAVADGVDVINFSIGGGAQPWNDVVSLAFLNATNAGVFVAASAGNSGPAAATLGHVEPWTTASAASQHGRAAYGMEFSVIAPTMPPALQGVPLTPGSGGAPAVPMTNTPVVLSPDFTNQNAPNPPATSGDGCEAGDYPAGSLSGAVAVIRRGGCSFTIKVNAAQVAGATGVIIANNAAGALSPSVPGTTIPAYGMLQADADAFAAYAASNSGIRANLSPVVISNTVDALASFSSRGPSGFDLLKPDITSPGVSILAAYAGTTLTGSENLIATISGTSMASPHTAGAAALMRQLYPSWTVMEIKSALQMTANQSVLLEDGVTPANPHAGGAGRTQVDRAARAGLVLDETYARFMAANPANGGDPAALNLASMESRNCSGGCTFVRTVRNTTSAKRQWNLRLEGDVRGQVRPSSLTLLPGESRQIQVSLSGSTLTPNGYTYGALVASPSTARGGDATLPVLRMQIALRSPPPAPPSTLLVNGVPVTVAGAVGSQAFYRFVLPAGRPTLNVTMSGGTGDADLFVKWGEAPTGAAADCVSGNANNNETCSFTAPRAGTWYVRVDGYTAFSGASLTASW